MSPKAVPAQFEERLKGWAEEFFMERIRDAKRQGSSIVAASREGGEGQSFRIKLVGRDAGDWRDARSGAHGNTFLSAAAYISGGEEAKVAHEVKAWLDSMPLATTGASSESSFEFGDQGVESVVQDENRAEQVDEVDEAAFDRDATETPVIGQAAVEQAPAQVPERQATDDQSARERTLGERADNSLHAAPPPPIVHAAENPETDIVSSGERDRTDRAHSTPSPSAADLVGMKIPAVKYGEQQFSLEQIDLGESPQTRAALNRDAVGDYAERMKNGKALPPIVVFNDRKANRLADGRRRYEAARQNGCEYILADVRAGDRKTAVKYALGANQNHGVRRTNADKHRCVEVAIQELGEYSDHVLAELCAVSAPFVGKIRRQLLTVNSSSSGSIDSPGAGASASSSPGTLRIGMDNKRRKVNRPKEIEANFEPKPLPGPNEPNPEPTQEAESAPDENDVPAIHPEEFASGIPTPHTLTPCFTVDAEELVVSPTPVLLTEAETMTVTITKLDLLRIEPNRQDRVKRIFAELIQAVAGQATVEGAAQPDQASVSETPVYL